MVRDKESRLKSLLIELKRKESGFCSRTVT